jgi:biopolymer transport protein ExbB
VATLLERYTAGGFTMHLILLCLALAIAITIDRILVIRAAASIKKDELLNHINSYILQGNLEKAISVTSQIRNPLTNIVRSGLVSVQNGKNAEEVQTAMDAVALKEIPRIEKRIGLLATVSNLATLLGLLGTVLGLIGAFSAVHGISDPVEKAQVLTASISEAMTTTAFGLMVAVPTLAAFGYLNSWAQNVIDDIHESSVATLNFILANKKKIMG